MTIDQQTLLHVIATSFFNAYPRIPDVIHPLAIEGLQGFEVPKRSNEWSNLLGAARLSPENADETIQTVYDYFAPEKRSFGWMIDSHATPHDLAERLQNSGLRHVGSYAGMVLRDMDKPIRINPAIRIRRATIADIVDIVALMNEAFGSGDSNRALYEYSLRQSDHFFHLAYVDELEEAVALGRMFYFPDTSVAVMQDAITTQAYQGRGIYTTLMAKRIEIARNDGKQVAIMQADRTSSAPICAKMGFEEISNLDFYIWRSSCSE
jgi:N-acetylglutamate synthase-like GNAT family acetyltransferase